MSEALVIGLDSSTQSTKAVAWNRAGQALAEGRADIAMDNPRLDYFEQNPNDWWSSAKLALIECIGKIDATAIEGIAISNQRETLAFIDEHGESSYPAIVWLDERNRQEVEEFTQQFGSDRIHQISGRPPDTTPGLYRFAWLRKHEPAAWNKTAHFVDVQAYLVQKFCGGHYRTGWTSADPMGIIDMQTKSWSQPLLDALSLDASRLPTLHAPGSLLGTIQDDIATELGLPLNTPFFAAGGDGQCAGLGVNCTVSDRAYINLGTAVVSGVWSPDYKFDRAWRTELAAQGNGYIYESCILSGALLINWFVDQFEAQGKADANIFDQLESAASDIPIGSDGLLVQPYFSGAMNPHWDSAARGVMLGLSTLHTSAHIYRAILEALTLDQVMAMRDLERIAQQPISHFVAIGGGANSPLWRQMIADASGKAVHISTTVEASALGAGMTAAFGAGWFPSIEAAASAMAGSTTLVQPDQQRHQAYSELLNIYRKLYQATASLNHEMLEFSTKQNKII